MYPHLKHVSVCQLTLRRRRVKSNIRIAFIPFWTLCSKTNDSPEWIISIIADALIASRSFKKTLACPRYANHQSRLGNEERKVRTVRRVYTFRREISQFLEIGIHDYLLFVSVFEWFGTFYRIFSLGRYGGTTSQAGNITSHDWYQLLSFPRSISEPCTSTRALGFKSHGVTA